MKFYLVAFAFLTCTTAKAQEWYTEIMLGGAAYNGDLTQRTFDFARVRPSASINLKYNTGDFVNFRAGFAYAKLIGDDKKNPDPGLQSRALNFQTSLYELSVCAEVNVLDPFAYYAYPYFFGGVGVFRYNPYTFDNENRKTFLQPLGTEGQGIPEYNRKKYSLYQVCFPVGGGFKINVRDRYEVGLEFGYRLLFTDYLDDVSQTYVNMKALQEANGPKAVELSYRKNAPYSEENEKRGNSKVKDSYFFAGIKIAFNISGDGGYYY